MKYKRTLARNSDGSLRTENGELVWIDGVDAVEQELETTLETVRGEDPFDEDHGLDIFEASGAPDAVVEREVRDALLQDDRVDSVDAVDVGEIDANRDIPIDVEVTLVDGVGLGVSTTL